VPRGGRRSKPQDALDPITTLAEDRSARRTIARANVSTVQDCPSSFARSASRHSSFSGRRPGCDGPSNDLSGHSSSSPHRSSSTRRCSVVALGVHGGSPKRLPRHPLRRVPRRALPTRTRRTRGRMLHPRGEEGRAPAFLVVPRELKVERRTGSLAFSFLGVPIVKRSSPFV
jgi:hypothetical protein